LKKLYLIRHAKSSWKEFDLADFDRPLNKRGKSNAPLMGKLLKNKKVLPDIVLSSPANRAKATAEIISKKVKYSKDIVFDKNIYESSYATLHNILKKLDNKNSVAFLVAHNPGLNMLAEYYVGFSENIPTCGVVEIEFDCVKWRDIGSSNAKLISFEYPKKYN
jgi:phosphohistidine phosphatase